jgi:hypothetical protein
MAWSNELRETAVRLWLEGRSAAFIAGELGPTVTRNAVVGLMHRSGIRSPKSNPQSPVGDRSPRHNYPRVLRPIVPRLKRPTRLPRLSPQPDSAIESKPVALMDASVGECRWPLNDSNNLDEFRFCGGPVWLRSSYCAGHLLMAYRTCKAPTANQDDTHPAPRCEEAA